MRINVLWAVLILIMLSNILSAQSSHKFEFDGQISAYTSYIPQNDLHMFLGGRYLPEMNYGYVFDKGNTLDFEVSASAYMSAFFHPFDSLDADSGLDPYRLWSRYSGEQFEVRLGLQKINFGSAMMLRPLQWFDEIDPRDPLMFTTGVYGALGRYYFLNNSNIWAWILYGNKDPRGFDPFGNNADIPELGGRIQLPVPGGEIAGTYHHRTVDLGDLQFITDSDRIPENRFAIDGKWDVEIGLWFEAAYINKRREIGRFSNQAMLSFGMDYTIGIGNGISIAAEHLIYAYDESAFDFDENLNLTAAYIMYPVGLFSNVSAMAYYSWHTEDVSFFMNYEYRFRNITGYLMTYYIPETEMSFGAEFGNRFSGPGIRLMLVYNH